ncbi:TRAP transporter small permease [Rhodophyticola sp. CCM32]|uniref:TRAP transporter small permease n=1 Tax=Rhodophyticola sp. CCM32 TaxID=2916397 RepID=UPI00107FB579|nr:TRAP transporter small permease [Rhodophyticola sp. CCM32]QBY01403.1 TRAP transporter small permease [Rhodophyticola sp. CCM32]
MPRFLKILDKNAETWALLVFYVMLVVTMAVEVLRREIFSYSSIWGEEIVRYCFIYLAWLGASAAVKERAHIRIDVLMHYLGRRPKAILYIFGDLVMLAVSFIAVYWSFETVAVSAEYGSVSHGLRVSMVWFLMAVPIGFTLLILRLLQSLWRDLQSLRDGVDVYEGDKLFD